MNLEQIIQAEDLVEVASVQSGEMYSWSQTTVYFQHRSGRFFVVSGSGCSCNYFGDDVYSLADFSEVSRQGAMDALRAEASSGYEAIAADEINREIAKVRDFR